VKAEQGNLGEAEKQLLAASESADEKYASLAKLSLAQIYFASGRADQGEKLLRGLIEKPTVFVSKEQATISLARHLMSTKPAEARKLLRPLLSKPGGVGQVAIALSAEIPQ
jgi:thioredoxin-like negative regulator of GroEL